MGHERSREIRNAHVLARCGVLAVEELRSIYANAKTKIDAAGLFADWIRGASNASVEGFNNKIRWLIKQAYGYRDFKYFKLKIFDLPNLKSRDGDY